MKYAKNLIKPRASDYHLGDGNVLFKAVGNGVWNVWFNEDQRNSNFDDDGCACYAGQKSVDIQMDLWLKTAPASLVTDLTTMGFMDVGLDGLPHFHSSPRFIENMTGNGTNGNSLPEVLDAIRKYGLLPWKDMPFDGMMTQATYFTPPTALQIAKAKEFLSLVGGKNFCQYHWVIDAAPKNLTLMSAAILQAPLILGIAVTDGWNQPIPTDPQEGSPPQHAVLAYQIVSSSVSISDNYLPYQKVLDAGYPIQYCIQAVVAPIIIPPQPPPLPGQPTPVQEISWIQAMIAWLRARIEAMTPMGVARLQGGTRSPKWGEVEKAFRKLNPNCKVCDTTKNLNVHHISPFHLDPAKELDPLNLITLCRNHHLLFGHFMNWSSFNKDVRTDSATWFTRIKGRP